ncbi:hypothetical protein QTP70_002763 [Hemibagrus guttatus]|uniref:Uncharacterized protein n=1 Tax=Hemibagrus guttatus TaxID=175788 RepID=A0AAE0UGX1_9TELE|nr:hypothetical protein QTP70_002763 [Hemibagrus guttatus]
MPPQSSSPCLATSVESTEPCAQTLVPMEYTDLEDVFKATKLPPHRPWDCSINLLPNAMPPKCQVYSLSNPESQAMKEYIDEALAAGYIRPSTSPAAAEFFFIEKRDGGL